MFSYLIYKHFVLQKEYKFFLFMIIINFYVTRLREEEKKFSIYNNN